MLNPHKIFVSQKAVRLIGDIDSFKGRWDALDTHTTNLNVLADVAAHGKNLRSVFDLFKAHPIDVAMLVKLSEALIGRSDQGPYRTSGLPLVIQDGARIVGTLDTAAPEEIEPLFSKLTLWFEEFFSGDDVHPLMVIAVFSGIFLQICPFEKGNQRMIRMLITLLMFRAGYAYAPYALLDAPRGNEADIYFHSLTLLKKSLDEGKPDWAPWIEYVLQSLKTRAEDLAVRIEEDRSALSEMPALSQKVMQLFDAHKRLQMKEIERLTRGRRATLKLRLGELVEGGYLKRHGQARSTWYSRV